MSTSTNSPAADPQQAWNQAHDRLQNYFNTFLLGDHAEVSRLTLRLLDEARAQHREDPSREPTTLVMEAAQKHLTDWLALNLDEPDRTPSHIYSSGCIALLLSRMPQAFPGSFLASPLAEERRQSLHQTLVMTGPDLKVSSMTPRHLDFGPMLDLAKQTWHRWNGRAVFIALLFWIGVYFVFYWWLSDLL